LTIGALSRGNACQNTSVLQTKEHTYNVRWSFPDGGKGFNPQAESDGFTERELERKREREKENDRDRERE
jgi:hypothetical protein